MNENLNKKTLKRNKLVTVIVWFAAVLIFTVSVLSILSFLVSDDVNQKWEYASMFFGSVAAFITYKIIAKLIEGAKYARMLGLLLGLLAFILTESTVSETIAVKVSPEIKQMRVVADAEKKRLADKTAEKRRLADEAAKNKKKRLADEAAEKKRLSEESAEKKRIAAESAEENTECFYSYRTGDSPNNPDSCKKEGVGDHGMWGFRGLADFRFGLYIDGKEHGRHEWRFEDECGFTVYDHGEEIGAGECENYLSRGKFKSTGKKTVTNPLGLEQEIVKEMAGKEIPYDYFFVLGSPETLPGTNNSRWVAYLPKANISFISNKPTDIITFATFGKDAESEAKKVPSWIKNQFSVWDGSHINLTRYIKTQLHDPGSYDHVKTVYAVDGNGLFLTTTFRATNAFNATVTGRMTAKADRNGKIIEASLVE